jgi:hypothetical protein
MWLYICLGTYKAKVNDEKSGLSTHSFFFLNTKIGIFIQPSPLVRGLFCEGIWELSVKVMTLQKAYEELEQYSMNSVKLGSFRVLQTKKFGSILQDFELPKFSRHTGVLCWG